MKTKIKLISSCMILGSLVGAVVPAYAQPTFVLEEIIVTAQKREQSLRDVTAVVNVVSGAEIEKLNLLNFEDIERVTSGLQLTQSNPRNATIALRGVTYDPESGSESAVAVYHNNVAQRTDNVFGAIYDLERVEVLKGPQGSVQGATSPGGAILIHTKKPSLEETEGFVKATFTRGVNGTNLQAGFGTPLIKDKLGIRIAAYDDQNDQNNVVNAVTGVAQDSEITSFRASLRWAPNENFEANLVHQNNDQLLLGTPQLQGDRTGASAFGGVAGVPCGFLPAGLDTSCRSIEARDRLALAANESFSHRDADLTTLNLDWTIGKHKLSYVYGHTDSTKTSNTEKDTSYNLPLQNFFYAVGLGVQGDTNYRTNQGTVTTVDSDVHELRFSSVDNSVWNYMFGVYSQEQNTSTDFEAWSTAARYIPLAAVANSPFSPIRFTSGHIEGINFSTGGTIPYNNKTEAIFTAHDFKLSESTTIEAALRYQEVERFNSVDILFGAFNQPENISIQNVSAVSLSPLVPAAFVPFVSNQIAGQVLQGTLASISSTNIIGVPEEFQHPTDDATTGRLALKHVFSDNLTTYVSYTRSFRQGGISIVPGADIGPTNLLYDSETSNTIELGAKSVFLDGRGELNIALYSQEFDGFLSYVTDLDYVTSSGAIEGLTGGLVFNGDAKNTGIDLDLRIAAGENWLLGSSISYTDAKFDNALVPCNIREPGERIGRCESSSRIAGTPELTAVVFGEFSKELNDGMMFYARANGKYNGGLVATRAVEFGTSAGETPSYILLDLFTGIRAGKWEISAFAKNILNEDADIDLSNPGDDFDVNNDFVEVNQLRPRTFGVMAQFNFK
jgi:iron complex outermembrane receptor protein